MKIKFLGTAAAEGIPAFACTCQVCENARKVKGKEIRTRLQVLINDDLMIDFGPDTYMHSLKYDIDYRKIDNILITHSHYDHFYLGDVTMLRPDYVATNNHLVNFYGGESAIKEIESVLNIGKLNTVIKPNLLKAFKDYKIGKYIITPVTASHNIDTSPLLYLINDGNKKILWAHDTGILREDTYNFIKNYGHLDLISVDCTEGFLDLSKSEGKVRHMSFDSDVELINNLIKDKVVDNNTKVILNHFSHNGKCTHATLLERANKIGYLVAFDGMEIEI